MVEANTNKGGRPPRGPRAGKLATLATRITPETRQALEDEANRTGRSLSQVVEIWLEEARAGRASMEEQLGGFGVAEALRAMAVFSKKVRLEIGPPEEDYGARTALIEGWRHMIERALPFSPRSKSFVSARALETPIAEAASRALKALGQLDMDHPARKAAEAPQRTVTAFPPPSGLLQSYGFTTPEPVITENGPSLIESLAQVVANPVMVDLELGRRALSVAELDGQGEDDLRQIAALVDKRKALLDAFMAEGADAEKRGRALADSMAPVDLRTQELINKLPRLPRS